MDKKRAAHVIQQVAAGEREKIDEHRGRLVNKLRGNGGDRDGEMRGSVKVRGER